MNEEKQLLQLQNHIRDLADKSYSQSIFTFSSFLGLAEQDVFHHMERELAYAHPVLYGGAEHTDRCMLRFGSPEEFGYEQPWPITCIHIRPLMAKFADTLSHRDFLGALMNLGIERRLLGDIINNETEAYLFCQEQIAEYICDSLTQVKHTHVTCSIVTDPALMPTEEPVPMTVQVSSPRIDAVIAKVHKLSREGALNLFRTGKVFVDGRLCENNSKNLSGSEVISVRGYGKFELCGDFRETRKGKLSLTVLIYK